MNNELIFMTSEMKISDTLKDLGVSPALLGYDYLREAIRLTMDDMSLVHTITKGLYPSIARRFDTTSSRVERAMRHAIETGWLKGNIKTVNKLFGYTIDVSADKPTNSEFIATVADYLRMTQGD